MALIYRAIWEEMRPNLVEVAAESALEWLRYKGLSIESLPEDETIGDYFDSRALPLFPVHFELGVNRATVDQIHSLQVRFTEIRESEQLRWTTTLTVLSDDGPGGTLWVDVERVSGDPFARVPFSAP